MQHTTKKLDTSQIEITVTVSTQECEPYLKKAAERLGERVAVKGFRKGKVPLETLKREVGEMAILQEAVESIVQKTYFEALTAEKLNVIGMPKIDIEKIAPGNDLVYRATVAVLPQVTLPDITTIHIEKKSHTLDEKKVTDTINALRGMHASEVIKSGPAEGTDKLVIDLEMMMDNVPVEGGQTKGYQVYLGEDHYIPGFNKEVAGMKKGEKKIFPLSFPKEHYQKQFAGKTVDFHVTATEVYRRDLPPLDDALAKTLGQDSLEKLHALVRSNLVNEQKQKAEQTAEIEMLETLVEKTTFETIPEVLIDSERQKMFYELKRDLERNGVSIEKYLEDIKKDEKKLFEEFRVQAEKRAKAALLSRQVALEQHIEVSKEEIDKEINLMREAYKENENALQNLKTPEVRESIATMLQNKKVMVWLKAQIFGETKE